MTHADREIHRKRIMETACLEGDDAMLLAHNLSTDELNDCVHITAQMLHAVFNAGEPPTPACWWNYIVAEALSMLDLQAACEASLEESVKE
jgi:hypothetical protein